MQSFPLGMNTNEKFSLLCLQVAYPPKQSAMLESGIKIYKDFPKELFPDHLQKLRGTIFTDQVLSSNIVFVNAVKANTPSIKNEESISLRERTSILLYALLLNRVKCFEAVKHIDGFTTSTEISTISSGSYNRFIWHDSVPLMPLINSSLASVEKIFTQILNSISNRTHGRLLRGCAMLLRGFTEVEIGERTNYIVRSLDALAKTSQGKGKKEFAERCSLFFGDQFEMEQLLKEQYNRRSVVVHMRDIYEHVGSTGSSIELVPELRSTELIALETYKRIFNSKELLAYFASDVSIDSFWNESNTRRRELFGSPVQVDQLVRDSSAALDLYHGF